MKTPFSILVPNYNGSPLLEEYLPSVLEAASSYSDLFEVIIVDDGSTDNSVDLLRNHFPQVVVRKNEKNVGFGESVNWGMSHCRHRIVVLLNNDVRIEKDFFGPLLHHFKDRRVFAVVGRGLIIQDGVVKNESVTRLEFRDGFLNLTQRGLLHPEEKLDEVCTVAHACGGFSAFDREKFLGLGGFDSLYYPFYWEDVDICYRAWKQGWWVLYEPGSVAHHRCHATIERGRKWEDVQVLQERNRLLFTWKNLFEEQMLLEHAYAVNQYVKEAPLLFKQGLYEGLKKIEDVLRRRGEIFKKDRLSDRDVIFASSNISIKELERRIMARDIHG